MSIENHQQILQAVLLQGPDEKHSDFDLRAILRFVRRYWILISACALLGGAAFTALSFAFPRIYRAEVLLAPASDSEQGMGALGNLIGRYSSLAGAVGIGLPSQDGATQIALARLQSRGFIEAFIAEEGLMPILYPDFPPTGQGTAPGPGHKAPTLQDAYQQFVRGILLVKNDKSTNLVTLRIDWKDREVGARWANKLVTRINDVMRADAIEETERNLQYLRAELSKADYVRLKDSISSLMEGQINKRMLAMTQVDYAFRVLDPARPVDANKKVAPKRLVFLVVGLLLGGVLGMLLALRHRASVADVSASETVR